VNAEPTVVDTIFVVTRDTLYISRPDTVIGALQAHRTPADWALGVIPAVFSFASFIAVLIGWRVAHKNAMEEQRRSFRREMFNEIRHRVVRELRGYKEWLERMFQELSRGAQTPSSYSHFSNAINLSHADVRQAWWQTLEEYDQLLPQMQTVANVMINMQHLMIIDIRKFVVPDEYEGDGRPKLLPVDALKQKAEYWAQWSVEQSFLVSDLLVHVQRFTQSEVLGGETTPVKEHRRSPRVVFERTELVIRRDDPEDANKMTRNVVSLGTLKKEGDSE
jgi:hypothetical protein